MISRNQFFSFMYTLLFTGIGFIIAWNNTKWLKCLYFGFSCITGYFIIALSMGYYSYVEEVKKNS